MALHFQRMIQDVRFRKMEQKRHDKRLNSKRRSYVMKYTLILAVVSLLFAGACRQAATPRPEAVVEARTSTQTDSPGPVSAWHESDGVTLMIDVRALHVGKDGGGSVGFGSLPDDHCRFAGGTFDFRSLCKQLRSFSEPNPARPRQVGVLLATKTPGPSYPSCKVAGKTVYLSNTFIKSLFDKAVESLVESTATADGTVGRRAKNVRGNYEGQPPEPHNKPDAGGGK